jgi:predicted MFS family arabinose efflux permease
MAVKGFIMQRLVRDPVVWLFTVTTLLLVLTVGVAGFYALGVSQSTLLPELDQEAHMVGEAVAGKVTTALRYGIPFDDLVGMDDYLGSILHAQPDIAYLGITDPHGTVLYRAGADAEHLLRAQATPVSPAATEAGGLLPWLSAASLDFVGPPSFQAVLRAGYFDSALTLGDADRPVGTLHVGVSEGFYRGQIGEQITDIAIVLLASLLIAFELLLLAVTTGVTGPLQTLAASLRAAGEGLLVRPPMTASSREIARLSSRAGALVDGLRTGFDRLMQRIERMRASRPEREAQAMLEAVAAGVRAIIHPPEAGEGQADVSAAFIGARFCAFLFVFAEEMARPFMPVYIQGLARHSGLGGSDLVVGLPLSLFMLVGAVCMPSLVASSERFGRRRSFLFGAALSTLGLLGTALALSYWDLLAWRALSAFGYAMTFVACQGHVLDFAGPASRARGVAVFVGGITAADICGPAIGGLLAGQAGFSVTIMAGAGLACLAGLAGMRALAGMPPGGHRAGSGAVRLADMGAVLRNGRFVLLLLLTAIPAKLLLTGALFFLVPLIAADLGASQAETGRMVMTYGLASFVLSSPFARLADRWQAHGVAVGLGSLVAGAGMLPLLFDPGLPELAVAVLALGIGQAMSISPQLALAMQVCEADLGRLGQAPVLGLYRLAERLGGALGPFIAGGLVGLLGHTGAMAALGVGTVAAAVLFSVVFLVVGVVDHPDDHVDALEPADLAGPVLLAAEAGR